MFFVIDEAQNLTPHEIKTILTRAGEGTKIVLTGDPYQIDNPYIDAESNGLTYVIEKFKDESIAAHVTLTKGERSELATLASHKL
jgi:PhoH-like ATPase